MSERMTQVDPTFQAWLLEGPERGPADGLETTLAATRRVEQRPPWAIAEWWRPASWISPGRSRTLAIALLVVAITVLALVAFVIGSQHRLPPPFGPAANGRIVYDTGIGGEVYLANADGTNPKRIDGEGIERWPVFSPDGTKIAFWTRPVVGQAGQNASNNALNVPFHIVVTNADGSDPHVIGGGRTFHACCPRPVAWSPDSRSIAFVVWAGGNDELWVLQVDGPGPAGPLISDGSSHQQPSWSPDGQWIAVAEEKPGDPSIHAIVAIHPDGKGRLELHTQRQIGEDEGAFGAALGWSPDSARLAYARGRDPAAPDDPTYDALLEVVGLDGVERRVFSESSGWLDDLSWSPDGRSIAVLVGESETSIQVIDLATGIARPISRCSSHYDSALRWSPDGRYLVDACPERHGLVSATGSSDISEPTIALPADAETIDIQRVAP
jgi:hypothetical protein